MGGASIGGAAAAWSGTLDLSSAACVVWLFDWGIQMRPHGHPARTQQARTDVTHLPLAGGLGGQFTVGRSMGMKDAFGPCHGLT